MKKPDKPAQSGRMDQLRALREQKYAKVPTPTAPRPAKVGQKRKHQPGTK
jgi:hypothetical protein